jgi:hypothetical protein
MKCGEAKQCIKIIPVIDRTRLQCKHFSPTISFNFNQSAIKMRKLRECDEMHGKVPPTITTEREKIGHEKRGIKKQLFFHKAVKGFIHE